jgi:uncharacterized glyoxalase superfamily protein PhnB
MMGSSHSFTVKGESMEFLELKPMLRSWDIPATIAFYTEILGFTCKSYNQEWGWAHLNRDRTTIMISSPNEHEGDSSPGFTGSLYITCDEVDDLWASLKDRVRVCYPIEDFDYGMREFGVYDNNGYILQFGKPLQ